tara:strand:+ start:153 stop:881 length:729 start_codon:yes stop_codon:yes gene_type:complete
MAISVDTVYQRVLALTNKEQRGYITPQEFNLFANHAQEEIFEQYFYDLNQAARVPGNDYVVADVDDMIEEKMQIFENQDTGGVVAGYAPAPFGAGTKFLPAYIYRVQRVVYNNKTCEILRTKDFDDVRFGGPLTAPDKERPIANIRNNVLRVVNDKDPLTGFKLPTEVHYYRKPNNIVWGYIVLNKKALYDPGNSIHFELHQSEESELVYKILKFAGVSMKREDVAGAAQSAEMLQIQQEKK